MRAGRLAAVLLFVSFAANAALPAESVYHLKGKVQQANGKSFGRWVVVFLSSTSTPFARRTIGDLGGNFGFKNLTPGTYSLTVMIPRVGEISRTIEISANFADAKRTVRPTLVFDRSSTNTKPSHKISAATLAIPDSALREFNRALDRLEKKDVEGTIQRLKRAIEIAPRFPAALNTLGTIYYKRKQYETAEQYFRAALNADPEAYDPLVNLGGTLLSLQRHEEALPYNLQAAKTRPNDPLAQSQLGNTYFGLRQYENAETHLKQAIALDPSHFSFPQLVLARVYFVIKNWPAAERELEEFLRLHPDSQYVDAVRHDLTEIRSTLPPKN
jgi:tetratricopeptide (TPR) repeat protein